MLYEVVGLSRGFRVSTDATSCWYTSQIFAPNVMPAAPIPVPFRLLPLSIPLLRDIEWVCTSYRSAESTNVFVDAIGELIPSHESDMIQKNGIVQIVYRWWNTPVGGRKNVRARSDLTRFDLLGPYNPYLIKKMNILYDFFFWKFFM